MLQQEDHTNATTRLADPDAVPGTFLKSLRPDPFSGQYRDSRAEDWMTKFERYCDAAQISAAGLARVRCAGLLMKENASRWYDQLGAPESTTIDGKNLSPYEVFKYRFQQRFINVNDAENAFDQLRNLRQKKSVNEYIIQFEKYRSCLDKFDNKDAVQFFRGGLKPELRQLVDNHPEIADDDINALVALAERLDKLNKSERAFNHGYYPSSKASKQDQETYPQPMDLDAVNAHPNTQSKLQRPKKQQDSRRNDLEKDLCFYCHETGHQIGACPERNKKKGPSAKAQAH